MSKEEDALRAKFKVVDKEGLRGLVEKYERLGKFLRSMLGEAAAADEDDDGPGNPADVGAMDHRRRMPPPVSAADRAMFEAANGISGGRRRIRNLGN